jgi:hypothetical protein
MVSPCKDVGRTVKGRRKIITGIWREAASWMARGKMVPSTAGTHQEREFVKNIRKE